MRSTLRVLGQRADGRPIYAIRGGSLTLPELVAQLRKRRDDLLDERAAHAKEITQIRTAAAERGAGKDDLTEAETTQVRALVAKRDDVDGKVEVLSDRVKELEAELERDEKAAALRADTGVTDPSASGQRGGTSTTTVKEPKIYRRDNQFETSFFRDLTRFGKDHKSAERIRHHMADSPEVQDRAATTSSFAGLIPPVYLTDMYAPVLRAGSPFANACQHKDLPPTGMSVIIPRGTTGAAVASQSAENTPVQETDQVDANLTVPVVTIAGQHPTSRQSIERGTGTDEIIFGDLAAAYSAEKDRQVIAGTGTSNQMLGVLNTAGKFTSTAYGQAATAALIYAKNAGGVGRIANAGTILSPRVNFMNPMLWAFLQAALDGSNRPFVVPAQNGPYNAYGINVEPGGYSIDGNPTGISYQVVGTLAGLPVVTDSNIPVTYGTGSDESPIIIADTSQLFLWEDPDAPLQLEFPQTYGNQLEIELVLYGYAAFTSGRYPQAVAVQGGVDAANSGQVLPASQF